MLLLMIFVKLMNGLERVRESSIFLLNFFLMFLMLFSFRSFSFCTLAHCSCMFLFLLGTPENSIVAAWWDYGYQLNSLANRMC